MNIKSVPTLTPAKAAFVYPHPSCVATDLEVGVRVAFVLSDWQRGETTIKGYVTKPLGANGCVGVRALVGEGEPDALYIVPVAAVTKADATDAADSRRAS